MRERIGVYFLIRRLDVGGAERQLAALARGLPPDRFDVTVASMYGGGSMREEFDHGGRIRLVSLEKRGRWDTGPFLSRLVRSVRELRPHLVHGYMAGANELALLAARSCGARAVWGIRVSDQDFSGYTRFRQAVYRLGIRLAPRADLIIANSHAGRDSHVAAGYPRERFVVIPNGIDVERFRPDPDAGARWRASEGYGADDFVIALPARLDPMKDHETFLRAAARLAAAVPQARFICLGAGDEPFAAHLRTLGERLGLGERLRWRPPVRDVVGLYCGADVITSTSSFGEGFPNVLGEAMACGAICVTTPCGDAARVVGDAGTVVPFRDADAVAGAWRRVADADEGERAAMRARARARVHAEFTLDRLVERSARAFTALVSAGERSRQLVPDSLLEP